MAEVLKAPSSSDIFSAERHRLVERFLNPWSFESCDCAYSQLTARCGQGNQHNYALFLEIDNNHVREIFYSPGSSKVKSKSSSLAVETAIVYFCEYSKGRTIDEVKAVNFSTLAKHFSKSTVNDDLKSFFPPKSAAQLEKLSQTLKEPLFSLYLGGAIPFILFSWAVINHALKQVIEQVVGVSPGKTIIFRNLGQINAVANELKRLPVFKEKGRGLEIGIRNLHRHTVDESSLRAGYQRDTYLPLLNESEIKGFADSFVMVGDR